MIGIIAAALQEKWKQGVIIDNRPGAGSVIGTDAVAKAAPDGYTLLISSGSTFTVNPALNAIVNLAPDATLAVQVEGEVASIVLHLPQRQI